MANKRCIEAKGLNARTLNGKLLYSHVVAARGGEMVFIAGQLARDATGKVVGRGDMRAQIAQVCENMREALAAAGLTPADLVQTTTFVTDIEEFIKHGDIRLGFFGSNPPTSTTVEVRRLGERDLMIEMNAIAIASNPVVES